MKYQTVPNTDLSVSTVGFGLWTVTTNWWGVADDEAGIDLIRRAYNLGVTFYDTADTYGDGKGETLLAEALGQRPRQDRHRHEVRVRLVQPPGAARSAGAPARLLAEVRPVRLRAEPEAPRH